MKKRFISLVAAAALVGGIAVASTPATSQAGTIALKGDTTASFYGFIRYEAGWSKDMASIYSTTPTPTTVKTHLESNATITRFGFVMKNSDANVCGRIEADFRGGRGHLRLRRAYVKHTFGDYYVKIGQEWGVEEAPTYSAAWVAVAGFGGNARMPLIALGGKMDLGAANLDFALAFEDTSQAGYVGSMVSRMLIPSPAAKIKFGINTGFGAPATVYAFGLMMPVKITLGPVSDKSKTPYVFGAGFELPVSMVAVHANYLYGKGANNYANAGNSPASYWVNANGSLKASKFYAYNLEGKITPMPCISLAAGYDYVKFKNFNDAGDKIKDESVFANVAIKTTNYTKLVIEWDHVKAKYTNAGSDTGNRFWFNYTYYF